MLQIKDEIKSTNTAKYKLWYFYESQIFAFSMEKALLATYDTHYLSVLRIYSDD